MNGPALVSDSRLSSLKDLFGQTITEADRRIITQYLLEVEEDVDACEKELKKLRLSIIAVETKRNRSKKTMEEYRSLLAPIHKVPPEILCSIFEFCCEQNVLQPTSLPRVMALSHVCRRFRRLCASTPSLWSTFAIPFHTWADFGSLYLLTTIFLAFSDQHPLRLSLDFENLDRQSLTNQLTHGGTLCNILSRLVDHSQRWKALEMDIMAADLGFDVFRPMEGRLPMLEVLRLSQPYFADESGSELDLFRDCPALHTVSITRLPYWPQLALPLEGAKSVELHYCLTRDALSHLHSCRNMERLELSGVLRERLDGFEGPKTFISKVKSLTIRALYPEELGGVLHYSTLPHLSALTIIGDASLSNFSVDPYHIHPLKECLLRSSCAITSFHMKNLPITDGDALSLLGLMPTLEILGIEEVAPPEIPNTDETQPILTSSFLHHLAIMDHDARIRTPFLPQLKDLSITVHGEPLDTEALLHAIAVRGLHHREVGVVPLTSFDFFVTGNPQKNFDDLMQALLYFNGTGLRVKASYRSA